MKVVQRTLLVAYCCLSDATNPERHADTGCQTNPHLQISQVPDFIPELHISQHLTTKGETRQSYQLSEAQG